MNTSDGAVVLIRVGVVVRPLTPDETARTTEIPADAIQRYLRAGMSEEEALREAAEFDSGGLHLSMEQYADLSGERRIRTDPSMDGFEVHTLSDLDGSADDRRICSAVKRAMRLDTPEDRWRRLIIALEREGCDVSASCLDACDLTIEVDREASDPLPEGM